MNQTDTEARAETNFNYLSATGKLSYRLTNDYLFRAMLQRNNKVLKAMTCSLRHLKPEEVESVSIENPVILGEAIDEKTYVLDVKALLNRGVIINYEMQVMNLQNWPERSLLYLCRAFDELQRGTDYFEVKPAVHICFLDYALFPEKPEFYATYRMMNEKNHHIYTDKFTLSVVDLKHIELATEEDKGWGIDYWASLFKAATWEEIKMLAEKSEVLREAADTVYELTQEANIRAQCRAREDYYRFWSGVERNMIEKDKELQARVEKILEQTEMLREQEDKIAEQTEKLSEQEEKIAEQTEKLSEQEEKIIAQSEEIARLKKLLAEKG